MAKTIGISQYPTETEQVVDGHCFILVSETNKLTTRSSLPVVQTSSNVIQGYCFGVQSNSMQYLGIAMRQDNQWIIPEVTTDLWEQFGTIEHLHMRLIDATWKQRARDFIQQFTSPEHRYHPLGHLRICGSNKAHNLVVDGGRSGFNKISLSQELIGWALFAKEQSQQCKQPLSEYFLRCLSYFDTSSKDNSQPFVGIIVVEGRKARDPFCSKKTHHHPLLNAGKEMLKRCTGQCHLINNPESSHS